MTGRTYLDTSDGMDAYAKAHGAKRDANGWYVEGEVPIDLLGLLPKKPNKPGRINSPACPKCGSSMVLRHGRSGAFWGCMQFAFTRCRGTVDYEAHLDAIENEGLSRHISSFLVRDKTPAEPRTVQSINQELQSEIRRIIALAVRIRGNGARAQEWLTRPKVGLGSRIPLDLMKNGLDGCREVEQLLLASKD